MATLNRGQELFDIPTLTYRRVTMNKRDDSGAAVSMGADLNPPFPAGAPAKVDAWSLVGQVAFFDPRRVKPMDDQPRGSMEGARIDELAAAIQATGQEEIAKAFPIDNPDYDVELIGSHRRNAACMMAGCMIKLHITRPPKDRLQQYMQAVAGNCNRLDLTPLEQMRSVVTLIKLGADRKDIATLFGKTVGWVQGFWGLRTLNPEVFPLLAGKSDDMHGASGRKLRRLTILPVSYALKLVRLPQEDHLEAANAMIDENMDVVAAERFVAARLHERKGGQGPYQSRTKRPVDQLQKLQDQAQQFEHFLLSYASMSHDQLAKMGKAVAEMKQQLLGDRLRRIASASRWIADTVNPRGLQLERLNDTIKGRALKIWVQGQLAAYTASGLPLEVWMDSDPKHFKPGPRVRDWEREHVAISSGND